MRGWITGATGLTVALVVWSVLVRVIVARSDPYTAFYFPDSWNYVVLPSSGRAHQFHGPYIYSVWDALIPGTPSESSVVALHQLLGVSAVLMVWAALRRAVSEPVAFGASLLFAAQPLTIFFEQTILTEAVSVAIVAGLLFLLTQLLANRSRWADAATLAALGGLAGVLVALRPASRFAVLAPLVVAAVIVVNRYWRRGTGARIAGFALVALLLATLLPAPLHVRSVNNDQFGTAALTPGAGTAVLAWWGWRLDCESNPEHTQQAQAALAASCERDEPEEQLMWTPGPISESMDPHDGYAETQSQLAGAATSAMLASPGYTVGRLVSKTWAHAFSPVVNLERYSNGSIWFRSGAARDFDGHSAWFGGESDRAPMAGDPAIFTLVRQSSRLPGVLALLLAVASVVIGLGWAARRTRLAEADQVGFVLVVSALGVVAANEAVVALGGLPIFRYWVPVLPALFVGAAVVTDYAVGRAAPQSTG